MKLLARLCAAEGPTEVSLLGVLSTGLLAKPACRPRMHAP